MKIQYFKKYFFIFLAMIIAMPFMMSAQLIQNSDGSYSIGTLDGTATILNQDVNTVDLVNDSIETRTVTLDKDKKTIISSEAEVQALQGDQKITSTNKNTIVDVSLFFQKEQYSKDQAREVIKKTIQDEVTSATSILNNQSGTASVFLKEQVQTKEEELLLEVDAYFNRSAFTDDSAAELNTRINSVFNDIEAQIQLRQEGQGEGDTFTFKRVSLTETLLVYEKNLMERQALLDNRNKEVFKDTDNDGLSDFDELYIYNTDPQKAFTVAGKLNDREKIIAGIDPLSETGERIVYEDPRLDRDAVDVLSYMLLGIDFTSADTSVDGKESLVLSGSALPNSLVTIYLFSTPRVITTETDSEGKWQYALGQDLENGEHTVYVATTDNKGRLLAKGSPTLITKSAQAAAIGVLVAQPISTPVSGVFSQYSFIFLIALFLIGVVVTVSLIVSTRRELDDEKVFIPIHPESTPFLQADDSPHTRNSVLYPNLRTGESNMPRKE